ncbi:FtsX-like permease family protein [Dactylosporangium sp. NPDC051541]|uniref:ABC transporter permease n=1 Tax=Dactylosporangium sp. NPDC051541 TaxID=3363977 RepID=UPI00379C360E
MITIALATLHLRWRSFAGTFVALALGSALMAALGLVLDTTVTAPSRPPQRYSTAPVVVAAAQTLTVPTSRGTASAQLAVPRGVPPEVVAALPDAVVDRVFHASYGQANVGRPWSALGLADQSLTAGRAPVSDDEIAVVDGPLGDRVLVVGDGGSRQYQIVGIVTRGPQPAVFFSDPQAAALSPRVDALALHSPAAEVRAVVGDRAQVLVGQDRARLDANREPDARDRNNAATIAGIALGFAVFVAIFLVASTFAFAVAQRRGEFALLRATGATPGQVRRLVYCEALFIATTASAVGAVGGPALGRIALPRLAPGWISVLSDADWPLWTAFGSGAFVALLGSLAAAWRASRVRPGEALRDTAVEPRTMPITRWVLGLTVLGTALATMVVTAVDNPAGALNRKTYMPVVMLLVAAAGLLAPALVRLFSAVRLPGTAGLLASTSAAASTRRTAAIAAPVLVIVGLAASLLTASALTDTAKAALNQPQGPKTTVYTLEGDTALIRRPAAAVTWVPDDAIMVTPDLGLPVGSTAHVWLADGSPAALRVIGELPLGSPSDVLVGAGNAFSASADISQPPSSASRTGLFVVLGVILGYAALSLVNTLIMAAPDRASDRRTLRLLGAPAFFARWVTVAETLIAVAVGVVLAGFSAVLAVGGLWLTLLLVTGPLAVPVPWLRLLGIAAATMILSAITALCSASDTER